MATSFLKVILSQTWDTAGCLYSHIPELIVLSDCKYLVRRENHFVELILVRVQAVLALSWQNTLLAASSQPGAQQRRCTASLLCFTVQRSPKDNSVIQICPFLGIPVAESCCMRQCVWPVSPEDLICFCRQSCSGLDLLFPYTGNCCNTANILGHHLWFFLYLVCVFENEGYSLSDQAGYKGYRQLGLCLLVLYLIFKCESVTALSPYFLWSCIHKRALNFIHQNPKHLFPPLKTGSL